MYRFISRLVSAALLLLLIALLVYAVPLVLAMPLSADALHTTLHARLFENGGTAYRDLLDLNFPGALWIQLLWRQCAGHSSEWLRALDLLVFSGIAHVLWKWLATSSVRTPPRLFGLIALFAFYFSLPESSHLQRDVWVLLPAMWALLLRYRTYCGYPTETMPTIMCRSTVEGLCWAIAFWIKPLVVLSAVLVVIPVLYACRDRESRLNDMLGLVRGILIIGIASGVWLVRTGTLPYFSETIINWTSEYALSGQRSWAVRFLMSASRRLFPWCLVYVLAIPAAVVQLYDWWENGRQRYLAPRSGVLLSAFYLSWVAQALFLQHAHDDVHVPGVMLGICILLSHPFWGLVPVYVRGVAFLSFVALACAASPLARPDIARPDVWLRCVRGSTPKEKAILAKVYHSPTWTEMRPIVRYLRDKQVGDGDVVCSSSAAVLVCDELGIRPSTRYVNCSGLMRGIPQFTGHIMDSVYDAQPRFIVAEMETASGSEQDSLPPGTREWSVHPIVFRAGRYLVRRVLPREDRMSATQAGNSI